MERRACPNRRSSLQQGEEIVLLVGLELTARTAGSSSERSLVRAEESMEELAALAESAGARVAERQIQARPRADAATLVGSGKVDQLKAQIHFHQATSIIFDRELTPTQQRNLEKALDV